MSTLSGALRDLAMSPSLREVSFHDRGFVVVPTEATRRLEAIPQSVVCGFEWGIRARDLWEIERRLDLVDAEYRGFAYEGATMAFTIRDAMAAGRGKRTRELLLGPGRPHIFLAYIGIGFAMSHLPRVLWRNVVPDLEGVPYHPTMNWFAVDGYGFDKAYFDTKRWVGRQQRPTPYAWDGWPDYFARAFDQGVRRALWFIHGGQVTDVISAVERFAADRHADLWSGVGLAATFAGGAEANDLTILRKAAGTYRPDLAQGAVFAAAARTLSNFVPPHTEVAVTALTDLSVASASALADDVVADGLPADRVPPYEVWRRKVQARLR